MPGNIASQILLNPVRDPSKLTAIIVHSGDDIGDDFDMDVPMPLCCFGVTKNTGKIRDMSDQ